MKAKKTTINGIEWKYAVRSRKARLVERELEDEMAGEIVIPSELDGFPVTSIGEHAFLLCESLRGVKIPDSVTSIGDWVFDCCSSLRRVTIPEGVTSIGYAAFHGCSSLKRVTIPKSVKRIGDCAFNGCGSLTSFIVDLDNPKYKSVNGMLLSKDGARLIAGVNGDVIIPDGVTAINSGAFDDRSSLKSVTIPESVTSIGDSAFWGCSSLTSFTVAVDNPNYKSVNGMLLSKDGTRLIAGVNGNVVIPRGVTSIGEWAFCDCSSLTSVTIPEGVTSIGEMAFNGCGSLKRVMIPEGVTSIGEKAFAWCDSLETVFVTPGDAERVKLLGEFPDDIRFVEKRA